MSDLEDMIRRIAREEAERAIAAAGGAAGELVDVAAAAKLAKVSPKTIRAWVAAKRLIVAGRAGRRLRLRVADVMTAIAGAPPAPEPEDLADQAVAELRRGRTSRRRG